MLSVCNACIVASAILYSVGTEVHIGMLEAS